MYVSHAALSVFWKNHRTKRERNTLWNGEVGYLAKQKEIRTVSFVHKGNQLVNTDSLEAEERKKLANWLKNTYLNALFRGKARFFESDSGREEGLSRESESFDT